MAGQLRLVQRLLEAIDAHLAEEGLADLGRGKVGSWSSDLAKA